MSFYFLNILNVLAITYFSSKHGALRDEKLKALSKWFSNLACMIAMTGLIVTMSVDFNTELTPVELMIYLITAALFSLYLRLITNVVFITLNEKQRLIG